MINTSIQLTQVKIGKISGQISKEDKNNKLVKQKEQNTIIIQIQHAKKIPTS